MDNRIIKNVEEFSHVGLTDSQFLDKVSAWLERADQLAQEQVIPMFVGVKTLRRLHNLAQRDNPKDDILSTVLCWLEEAENATQDNDPFAVGRRTVRDLYDLATL